MPKFDTDLIPSSEAASILRCHIRTIHRLVRSGQLLPAMKVPGKTGAYLFRRGDVEKLSGPESAAS